MNSGLFDNSSQTIGPKGLNFSEFDGGHPEVIIRMFGEDWSKPCPWGYFISKFPGWGHSIAPILWTETMKSS